MWWDDWGRRRVRRQARRSHRWGWKYSKHAAFPFIIFLCKLRSFPVVERSDWKRTLLDKLIRRKVFDRLFRPHLTIPHLLRLMKMSSLPTMKTRLWQRTTTSNHFSLSSTICCVVVGVLSRWSVVIAASENMCNLWQRIKDYWNLFLTSRSGGTPPIWWWNDSSLISRLSTASLIILIRVSFWRLLVVSDLSTFVFTLNNLSCALIAALLAIEVGIEQSIMCDWCREERWMKVCQTHYS